MDSNYVGELTLFQKFHLYSSPIFTVLSSILTTSRLFINFILLKYIIFYHFLIIFYYSLLYWTVRQQQLIIIIKIISFLSIFVKYSSKTNPAPLRKRGFIAYMILYNIFLPKH